MIAYFDTSALIPLLIEEPTSVVAARFWDDATRLASVRLLYPDARAALALAHRMERLTSSQLRAAVGGLELLDQHVDHVEVTAELAARAGELAEAVAMRGYDAVHLAAADGDLIVVAGDLALRSAAHQLGLATATLN